MRSRLGSLALGAAALALASCTPADEPAEADEGVVVGTAYYSLTSGAVQWLNGTYTTCSERSGAWSTRVSGNGTMTNPALTVVKNDAACKLTITSIMADQLYTTASPILLTTAYAGSPSTFGSGGSQFLGNAKLDVAGFASDFQISFIYADTSAPPVKTSTVSAAYATVQATTVATTVAPSSYVLDTSGLRFQADLIKLIYGITGNAILVDGVVTGDRYAIEGGALSATPTFAQVQAAFDAAAQKVISGANPTIAASEFNVVSLSLLSSTAIRNVIVKRTIGGISAYQVFRVTFVS